MSGAPPKRPKGIQFVKSSDVMHPESSIDKGTVSPQQSISSPPSLLSLPGLGASNVNSSHGERNSLPLQPLFGAPAVSFDRNDTAKIGMSVKFNQTFVKSGDNYSSLKSEQRPGGDGYKIPGTTVLTKAGKTFVNRIPKTTTATPVCSNDEYFRAWKGEKDPLLGKIRKLVYEIVTLKSDRPNAMDKLHSAANRVPIRIEFNTEPVMGVKNSRSFVCYVFIEGVNIASGRGSKIRSAKSEAYEEALQKIFMPYMRVVSIDPTTKEIEVSQRPFTTPPREPSKVTLQSNSNSNSCQHKESNLEAAGLKRRHNEYKNLDEFVIVEPKVDIPDCTAAHTLRKSADFNHMLLEYEYFFKGESARCILKIENEVLAEVNGVSKVAAKNTASVQALARLKKFCWIIKTKQAVDSDSMISKDEIFNELNEQSESIANDNIGNQMLRKMGWSGGGVGKDGDGIAEPVSLKSVLNREGLGLDASKGVTSDFKRRIKDVIENYAASDNQEDLVFSSDFRLEERQIIHDECRRLNLRSKSRGKGQKRYLCVRRKRSVNQLFDHLMSVGGETTRYQLVPPQGNRTLPNSDMHAQSSKFSKLQASPSQHHPGPGNSYNFTNKSFGSEQSPSNGSVSGFQFGSSANSGRGGFNQGDHNKDNYFNSNSSDFGSNNMNRNVSSPQNDYNVGNGYGSYDNTNQQGAMHGGFRNNGSGVSSHSDRMAWGNNAGGGSGYDQQVSFQNSNAMHSNVSQNDYQYNISGSGFSSQTQLSPASGQWFAGSQGQGYGDFGQSQGYGSSMNDSQAQCFGNGQGMMGGGSGFGSSHRSFSQQSSNFGFRGSFNRKL